jgi:hypothetical protein
MTPATLAIAQAVGVIVYGHVVVGPGRTRFLEATGADLGSAEVPDTNVMRVDLAGGSASMGRSTATAEIPCSRIRFSIRCPFAR